MEPTKPKVPREAVALYNLFIHGDIGRREFMEGLQKFAAGGLGAAAIAEALMPNYALGQQVARNDDRIKASYETVPSPKGTAASRDISCGRSALTRGTRCHRNFLASLWCMRTAV